MKLNDKHLAAFASGTAPIDKQGLLSKRGEMNRSFHKRWFILKGNLLFYYEKQGDRDPLGVVILEGCTVELSESSDAFTFELVFQGAGSRTYVLAAETQDEMESWMKAIACAGYDYMKLMVAELQRQVDDITTDKTPIAKVSAPAVPAGASNSAEGLLVDLSFAGAASAPKMRQPSTRRNPFNAGLDEFGATPFVVESQGNPGTVLPRKSGPRTFNEMHRDFGAYINKKLAEGKIPIATGLLD